MHTGGGFPRGFLGWKHPGPIEALLGIVVLLGGRHFWDGNIPAPLKLRTRPRSRRTHADFWDGNIPAPLKRADHGAPGRGHLISGMETSRPH